MERAEDEDAGQPRSRRSHGSLEAEVLTLLTDAGGALNPGEVRELLVERGEGDLAYSTVVTVLSRLYAKGLLERTKRGRSFEYEAVTDQSRLAAQRLRHLLDARDDRDAVLAHFVGDLSAADAALLRRLIGAEHESTEGTRD
jgi:predicted transcriptional regulator